MNVLGKIHFQNISLLRRVKHSSQRLLSLERPACKVGQSLASDSLDFRRIALSP